MIAFRTLLRLAVAGAGSALAFAAHAKPPMSPKEEKKPSPTPAITPAADEALSAQFLRWLLVQNGGSDAISVGWPELVRVTTGKRIVALDPGNAADTLLVTKFGAALDQILPRLNRRDGALRAAAPLTSTEVAARIGDELKTALGAGSGMTVDGLPEGVYPTGSCVDVATGKTYYFSVVLYPSGGRDGTIRALTYPAGEGAKRITADGCCLLVAIEHNGKVGSELSLLNWELIDLAKVSVRCAVGFDADQNALHQPGAIVTDGRKGRD